MKDGADLGSTREIHDVDEQRGFCEEDCVSANRVTAGARRGRPDSKPQ